MLRVEGVDVLAAWSRPFLSISQHTDNVLPSQWRWHFKILMHSWMLWWQMKVGGRGKGEVANYAISSLWIGQVRHNILNTLISCFSPFLCQVVCGGEEESSLQLHGCASPEDLAWEGWIRVLQVLDVVVFPSLWERYSNVNERLFLVGWMIFVHNWEISSV